MAVTVPIDIQGPRHITREAHSPEIVVHVDDLKGVRLYCRLAAVISALAVVLVGLVAIWISILLFDGHWDSRQTLVLLAVVLVAAAVKYFLAELRLRSYRLDLTSDAVIFEYGRKRSYVPREHIQLLILKSRSCCGSSGSDDATCTPEAEWSSFRPCQPGSRPRSRN